MVDVQREAAFRLDLKRNAVVAEHCFVDAGNNLAYQDTTRTLAGEPDRDVRSRLLVETGFEIQNVALDRNSDVHYQIFVDVIGIGFSQKMGIYVIVVLEIENDIANETESFESDCCNVAI